MTVRISSLLIRLSAHRNCPGASSQSSIAAEIVTARPGIPRARGAEVAGLGRSPVVPVAPVGREVCVVALVGDGPAVGEAVAPEVDFAVMVSVRFLEDEH